MSARLVGALVALGFGACEAATIDGRKPAPSVVEPAQATPSAPTDRGAAKDAPVAPVAPVAPAVPPTGSERTFGAPPAFAGEPVSVAAVLADPGPHLGKRLKCSGLVARVCERAGCWLELKPEQGEGGLRVPMAGHAFFIPQDAVGKRAVVEGELTARPLPEGERAHLEGEGLKAIGPLSLAATSVVLR